MLVDTVPERLLHQSTKENEQRQSNGQVTTTRASASAGLGTKTFSHRGPARYQFSNAVYVRRHQDSTATTIVRHKPNSHELSRTPAVVNARQAKAEVKDAALSKILNFSGTQVTKQVKTLAWQLGGYVDRFLDEAYTPLVGLIFKNVRPGLNVSEYDEQVFENFVRLVAFCTKHVRLREEKRIQEQNLDAGNTIGYDKSPFECLSTTISWDAFQLVQSLLESAAVAEIQYFKHNRKAPIRATSLLKSVGDMLREMLLVLDLARAVGNSADKHAAVRLQQRLVYHEGKDWGLLGSIVRSIKDYSYQAHSRSHAVNLVEALHIAMMTQDAIHKQHSSNTIIKGSKPDREATDATNAEMQTSVEWSSAAAHWFRRNCAQPAVLQFYTWLLQGYATNNDFTNNAIVDYLQRIVLPPPTGLGLEPMLWQLSILRLFYSIMSDPLVRKQSKFAPLLKLCKIIVRSLFDRLVVGQFADEAIRQGDDDDAVETLHSEGNGPDDQPLRKQIPKRIETEVKKECGGLGFIELLFWKSPSSAEIIADEYNWKRAVEEINNRQGGGAEYDEAQLAFASFRGNDKGAVAPEYFEEIRCAFETCNGMKNCLDILVEKLGGRLTKQQISSSLRHLGLKRGSLTVAQEEMVRSVYRQHCDEKIKRICEVAAERLDAGFSVRQLHGQLVKLGLVPGKAKHITGPSRTNWDDVLGSEDDLDDLSPTRSSSPPSSAAKRKAFDDLVRQMEEENKSEGEEEKGKEEEQANGPRETFSSGVYHLDMHDPEEESEEERTENEALEAPANQIPERLQKLLQYRKANGAVDPPDPPEPTAEQNQIGKENENGFRRLKKKRSGGDVNRGLDPVVTPSTAELEDF